MNRHDDGTLYERWLENRDADAFAELARRHTPVVYDLAVRASGDRALAEDMVQEALLDLAQAGTRKPIDIGIVAWMARFAICRSRNARSSERSRARRQRVVGERSKREVHMPDEKLATNDELEHALSCAEPEERTLLAMRYLHGWEYRRIAATLSLSQGAARVRVHRALAAVRRRLGVGVGAGAAAPAAFAALPLHAMRDGFLQKAVTNAVQAVPLPATAGLGRTPALRGGWRIPVVSLGLVSALSAVTIVATDPVTPSHLATGGTLDVAHTLHAAPARNASPDGETAGRAPHAVPRPPEWEDGVLLRLGREGGRVRTSAADTKSGVEATDPAQTDETRAVPGGDDPSPPEMLRPTSREARAATRVPVSSEDERAGNSAGRGKAARRAADDVEVAEPTAATAVETAELPEIALATADVDVNPGLPSDLSTPDPRRTRRKAPVERKPIDELDEEQQALIGEAADLVLDLVARTEVDLDALADSNSARRQEARRLKRRFRAWRRELAQLDDAVADAPVVTTRAQRVLSVRVIGLLMQVALADGQAAGELVWPDGADWTVALEDVVRVFETAEDAGLTTPDGVDTQPGAPASDAAAEEWPDALPDAQVDDVGLVPDGALPDGAIGADAGGLPEGLLE